MQYFVWYVCGWILFPTINKIVIGSFENISWKYKLNKACIVVVICIAVWVSINMYFQNGVVKEFGIISDNTLFLMLLSILQPLIVILWWVFVSVIFQNNIVLQNVGRNTLYLNGNEFIVRELINAICMTMGINICIDNPLQAIIQAILFITIIYKIFLSWEAKSLIIIQMAIFLLYIIPVKARPILEQPIFMKTAGFIMKPSILCSAFHTVTAAFSSLITGKTWSVFWRDWLPYLSTSAGFPLRSGLTIPEPLSPESLRVADVM